MRNVLASVAALALGIAGANGAALAQGATTGEQLRAALEAGEAQGAAAQFARASGDVSRQAQGFAEFTIALEKLVQGLYRYGLTAPRNPFVPVLRLPVPVNPRPEPVDYVKVRALYQAFLDDLGRARDTLVSVKPHDGKLVLDVDAIRLTVAPGATGSARVQMSLREMADSVRNPLVRSAPSDRWEVAFDYADALWLKGYSHVLSGVFEMIMAHEWQTTWDATAHLFFAGAPAPKDTEPPGASAVDLALGGQASGLVDQIAFLHLIHWPAGDKARMSRARLHFKAVVETNRQTWKAIEAETDDDREWLPSPRQMSRAVPSMPVTAEMVSTWMASLDEIDAVLDGRKLIPHWRYKKGINLRKVFEEPRPFDLVLWITGHGAVPFLEDGPMVSPEVWWGRSRIFGGSFLGYAVYFN